MENWNQTSYLWWLLYFNKTHPTVASDWKSFMITKSGNFDSNKSSGLKQFIVQWIPLSPYKMLTYFRTSQYPLRISTVTFDKNYILIIAKFSNAFLYKIPSPLRMTALLEKLLVPQLVKKFQALSEIQMPVAKFITAQHVNLSTARLIKSKPFHMNTSFTAVFQLPLHHTLYIDRSSTQ